MKIEQKDLDCLVDVSVFLRGLRDYPGIVPPYIDFKEWHERVRKVYMMLFQVSDKSQFGLEHLLKHGIPDDSNAAKAIRLLCPHTGQN